MKLRTLTVAQRLSRDQAQLLQYENSDALGYAFVALPTVTFGRPRKPTMALQDKQAECASADGFAFKDGRFFDVLRKLSVGLCRGNCMMYK